VRVCDKHRLRTMLIVYFLNSEGDLTVDLYREQSSDSTYDAQRNLMGRTHYVDPDTLKYHKSRVLAFRIHADGLLCSLIESCAADMHNRKRRFRYVIFDVLGTVLDRPKLDESFTSKHYAEKAMWKAVESIDAIKHTREALQQRKRSQADEYKRDLLRLKELKAKK
jgi:hypothetical protein